MQIRIYELYSTDQSLCAFLCTFCNIHNISIYIAQIPHANHTLKYSNNFICFFSYLFHQLLKRSDYMPVPIKLGIFFNKTCVNWLSTNSYTAAKIYTFQIVVQQQPPPQARLLYGYGTSSILSNIKNATGNIAGTLDDFGSGSGENKNMYRESEWDEWFCHHFDKSSVR